MYYCIVERACVEHLRGTVYGIHVFGYDKGNTRICMWFDATMNVNAQQRVYKSKWR